jgi:hypothetical protein
VAPVATSRPKGLVGRFTAKVGPLPVWGWAALLLVGGYLAYRLFYQGGSSSSTTATPATDTTGAGSDAGTAGSTPAGGDFSGSPSPDTQAGLNGDLLSQLSGFQNGLDALTAAVQSSPAFWPTGGDSGAGSTVPNDGTQVANPQPTARALPAVVTHSTPASSPNYAAAAVAKTAAAKTVAAPQPFGGVVSVSKLKNGSTVTTYASGRKVQQAPGKTAYVIKK